MATHHPLSLLVLFAALGLTGCPETDKGSEISEPPSTPVETIASATASAMVDPLAPTSAATSAPTSAAKTLPSPPCPSEMVFIPGNQPFCIDRWEAILEDKRTGRRFSPFYSPVPRLAKSIRETWQTKRTEIGSASARAMPLRPLSDWQLSEDVVPMAVSRPGEIPQGYVSGKVARTVCENAGKRLCLREEWVRACRGAADRPFPYGETYEQGTCNIYRRSHPAAVLHDNPSIGHLDPRLNLVEDKKGPLLRLTGETKTCASKWGNDAVYDMVGNLDEWVEDESGVFVGGFFSRGKKDGCASVVKNHSFNYWDYSLGVRCCSTPSPDRDDDLP